MPGRGAYQRNLQRTEKGRQKMEQWEIDRAVQVAEAAAEKAAVKAFQVATSAWFSGKASIMFGDTPIRFVVDQ
jgi:hypothetical protein